MKKIKLKKDVCVAGKHCSAGQTISLDDRDASFFIGQGIGVPASDDKKEVLTKEVKGVGRKRG